MWSFASNAIASIGLGKNKAKLLHACFECSDDDACSNNSREESLECPICWESFNIVENVPYVLWCGHTLCKNCVLGLQCSVLKFHMQQIKFPFLIFCPWCHLISLRLVHQGNLKFPSKNFFLLWMIESMNGDRTKFASSCVENQPRFQKDSSVSQNRASNNFRRLPSPRFHGQPSSITDGSSTVERNHFSIYKLLDIFIHFTSKFPLVIVLLLIVFFLIPGCAVVLVIYVLLTVLIAIPSFLLVYFAYPALDWLVREITS